MGGISYKETLGLIEELMINSYIRKYCSNVCKGRCCENCYNKNPDSCRHHEGRRLPCSIFICGDMLCLFSGTNIKSLEWLNKNIKEQYFLYRKVRHAYTNIYFTKPDKVFTEIVRFPKKIRLVISNINTEEIKKKNDQTNKSKNTNL